MDISKFADYPLWVKLAALVWLLSSFVMGAAVLFAKPLQREEDITDAKLIVESKQLAQELFTFTRERRANAPQVDSSNGQESTNRMIAYDSETNDLYASNFQARVIFVKEEFAKRNLTHQELETLAAHPTNYIGLNGVASALNELSLKLERSIK